MPVQNATLHTAANEKNFTLKTTGAAIAAISKTQRIRHRHCSASKNLTRHYYFHNIGNMEIKNTIHALSALAQESRLAIFRLLVVAGPAGMPVGKIAEELNLANATLSFHLKELTNAALTTATPNGRSISYAANFTTMQALIAYLTENCCAGAGCAPAGKSKSACSTSPLPVSAKKLLSKTHKRSKS